MLHDAHNDMFTLAADFINYTNRSVFLTGRAGTGKTTFLKYIKSSCAKQSAVIAPTGVAAINAGGVTIHSFFQLPFTPFVPERKIFTKDDSSIDAHHLLGRIKMNRERRKILQQLELLIIDEISMVRCDVLDAIDLVLRHFRFNYNEPFGGVQLLFIGDMFQLPPVVQDDEWRILSQFYSSPFFFDSKVLQEEEPVHIELNKIYRQNEQQFIELLNKVRNNEMDEEGFELLNSRYQPNFIPSGGEECITLTTHNYKADTMNADALQQLQTETKTYKAIIKGEFNEKSYPAEELLQLKTGAQVMMIKNDPEKKYFNGRIGIITKLEEEIVQVQCKDEVSAIEIKREVWENIRYALNPTTQTVEEDVAGSFEQFPLRLAWAITIHKSQGLTFERAVIDAGSAFAAGQVYVALSRCTTLQGVILKSRITNNGLHNDERIIQFSRRKQQRLHLLGDLDQSKKMQQLGLLKTIFDLTAIAKSIEPLQKFVEETKDDFNEEALLWINKLQEKISAIEEVAAKFRVQIETVAANTIPEQNETLQQRIVAAAKYFSEQLTQLSNHLLSSAAVTDSKQKAMVYNDMLQEVHAAIAQKLFNINGCKEGFNTTAFYIHRQQFRVPAFRVNAYSLANKNVKADVPHPALYQQLRLLRDKLCAQRDVPVYFIASGDTLNELVTYLPQTKQELAQINGFGKSKIESFGEQFLEVINNYCKERGLSSNMKQKIPKKERKEKKEPKEKIDTKFETFKLYKEGKTIEAIATERSLTLSTIEGHLAHYISTGEISIEEIVSKEKIILIEPVAKDPENTSINVIRSKLQNKVSFGEIKLVIASLQYSKKNSVE